MPPPPIPAGEQGLDFNSGNLTARRSHSRLNSILEAREKRNGLDKRRRSTDPLLTARNGSTDSGGGAPLPSARGEQYGGETPRRDWSDGGGEGGREMVPVKQGGRDNTGPQDATTGFLTYDQTLDIDLMTHADRPDIVTDTSQSTLLYFNDSSLEEAYQLDFLSRSVGRLQLLMILATLFHIAYGLSDILYVKAPSHVYIVRLGAVVPLHIACGLFSLTPIWRERLVWESTTVLVLINSAYFCYYASTKGVGLYSDEISPPTALSLFFVVLFSFVRMDLLRSIAVCIITIIGYMILFAIRDIVSNSELLGHFLVLITAATIGVMGGYMLERFSRNSFVEIVLLEERHEHILDRKKRAGDLMLNILPAPVATRLIDNRFQETVCDRYNNVTVMFVDVQGLSSSGTPQDIVEELNHIFEIFDEIIMQYGGEKIKSIGSVYMVAAGVPIPNNQHAVVIAKIALNMMYAIEDMNARHGDDDIQLMIGINSGEVVAGVIGTNKYCFDIYGDTVNTASRMESSSLPGNIQLSSETHQLLKASGAGFMMQKRGEIYAKGKGRIKTYWLLGEKSRADRPILLPMNDPKLAEDRINHPELFTGQTESSSEESSSDSGSEAYMPQEAYVESFQEIDQREGRAAPVNDMQGDEEYEAHRRQALASVSNFRNMTGENEQLVILGSNEPRFFFPWRMETRFQDRYLRKTTEYWRMVAVTGILVHGLLAFADMQYSDGSHFILWLGGFCGMYVLLLALSLLPVNPVLRNMLLSCLLFLSSLAGIPILAIVTSRTSFFRSLLILQICFAGTCVRVHTVIQSILLFGTLGMCMPFVDDSFNIGVSVGYVPVLVMIGNFFIELYIRRDYLLEESMKAEEILLEKEKTKCDELLLNVLPRSVVNELKDGLDSRHFTSIAASHPSASILFSDLVGFTALSSTMQAKQLVSILNEIFSEFDRSCLDLGLEKIKTIGDAFFSVGGIFDSTTTDHTRGNAVRQMGHAEATCQQALEMMQSLNHFNKKHPELGLQMRIGLHYGPVMGGVIGTRKFIFDVWGEAVDTSQEMESGGVPGRIQCSNAMYEQVKDIFIFEKRVKDKPKKDKKGRQQAPGKGKGGPGGRDRRPGPYATPGVEGDGDGFFSGFFSGFTGLFGDEDDYYSDDDHHGDGNRSASRASSRRRSDLASSNSASEEETEEEPTWFLIDRK